MKDYHIFKTLCSRAFYTGVGNFWFEHDGKNDNTALYKFYRNVIFLTYFSMTCMEILAAILGDFPDDEKSDSITFSVSHTVVLIKITTVMRKRKLVKQLFNDVVRVCDAHEENHIMNKKSKVIKLNILAYILIVFGAVLFYVSEGLRKLYFEGTHFVTIVTYWPGFEDNSRHATAMRIFTTIILVLLMLTMISVEALVITVLVSLKYKFITLRNYFNKLSLEVDALNKSDRLVANEHLCKGLIQGIKMHQELLSITGKVQECFGLVMSMQLCQSTGSVVSLLLQLTVSDQQTFTATVKLLLFVVALYFLLAVILCNAGEIPHQAALLTNSIFYCGWHTCARAPEQRNARQLALFTVAASQRPLVMKAFKMVDLTYSTFLSVLRLTYSIFAVLNARNN